MNSTPTPSTTINERQSGTPGVDPVGKTVPTSVRPIGGGYPLGYEPVEFGDLEKPVGFNDQHFSMFTRVQRLMAQQEQEDATVGKGELDAVTEAEEILKSDSFKGSIILNEPTLPDVLSTEVGNILVEVKSTVVNTGKEVAAETPEDLFELIGKEVFNLKSFNRAFENDPEEILDPEAGEQQERNIRVVEFNRDLESSQNQAKSQRVRELEKNTVRITEGQMGINEVAQLVGKRVEELGIHHPLVIWTRKQQEIKQANAAENKSEDLEIKGQAVDPMMSLNHAGELAGGGQHVTSLVG